MTMMARPGLLPKEPLDLLTHAFGHFFRIEAASGAVLLLCTLIALALANSPLSSSIDGFWGLRVGFRLGAFTHSMTLDGVINDGLMTLFFFLVALEMKREMVLGELASVRGALLSLAAALGGMVVPAAAYLVLMGNNGSGGHGWGTAMTTDTAFVIGCLAILGKRVPRSLKVFLLSLAIFDDIGAILVIALGYGNHLNWSAVGLALLGIASVAGLAHLGLRSVPMYFALGMFVWLALDVSGIHPTIAGVVLGLMTPARSWVSGGRLDAILAQLTGEPESVTPHTSRNLRRANVATREALPPVERLERSLHPWVAFLIMPLFALANAGVPLSFPHGEGRIMLAVCLSLVLGKPIGVILFSYVAVRAGWASRPVDLTWSILVSGSILTGIGFTMALLIANLAFDPTQLNSAKMGILLASTISASVGMLALAWLGPSQPSI